MIKHLHFLVLFLPLSCSEDIMKNTPSLSNKLLVTSHDYIGLNTEDAMQLSVERDVPFRVIKKDGESTMVTKDYRPGRINATIENGIVTDYKVE